MLHCNKILLSTAYLPNIQYFSKVLFGENVTIEVHDTYQKQSYRNRTTIIGANGPLDLIIPVKRPQRNHTKTCDILLDFDMPWRQAHWKAIRSAYRHSPFFEIFEEEIKPLYFTSVKYLIDWNFRLLDSLMEMIGRGKHYSKSTEYYKYSNKDICDYRESIHPKKRMQKYDPLFDPLPYFQVFAVKHGFHANLSFIDLLFNEGPQAVDVCLKSIKKGNL
jgi:hypothetical protein